MNNPRPKQVLERGAASDLWRHTLSQIPSVFGRLIYLSGLREVNSGRYEHHGLALVFGERESDRALKESHKSAMEEWLGYGLEQQKADLDLYVSGLIVDKRTVLDSWLRTTPYRNLTPGSIKGPAKKLFILDLEILLELLRNELGVAADDPNA
jgi:hypothetical protein